MGSSILWHPPLQPTLICLFFFKNQSFHTLNTKVFYIYICTMYVLYGKVTQAKRWQKCQTFGILSWVCFILFTQWSITLPIRKSHQLTQRVHLLFVLFSLFSHLGFVLCGLLWCASSTGLTDVKQINITSGLDLNF